MYIYIYIYICVCFVHIGEVMTAFVEEADEFGQPRDSLISSHFATLQLFAIPLLQYYLNQLGMEVTRVYSAARYEESRPFAGLVDRIAAGRRAADADASGSKAVGEMWKLIGNSIYGR